MAEDSSYEWIVEHQRARSFRCPCCASFIVVDLNGQLLPLNDPREPIDFHQLLGEMEAAGSWLKLARKYVLAASRSVKALEDRLLQE